MKHEYPTHAHPQHPPRTGHGRARTDGQRDKPSPAFDANASDGLSSFALWRSLPLSTAFTVLLLLVLVTVAAAVALRAPDPTALITPLAWGSVGLASLVGGMIAGRRSPERPVVAGLLCGGAVVLLLVVAGLAFGGQGASAWLLRLCVLPLHLIGACVTRPRRASAAHHDPRKGAHHRR